MLAAGLAARALAALLLGRVAQGTLYGVAPPDPWTFGVVITGFALVGAGPAWLPARRALRIDPADALRVDQRWPRPAARDFLPPRRDPAVPVAGASRNATRWALDDPAPDA